MGDSVDTSVIDTGNVSDSVDYSQNFFEIQQSLDEINVNLQYANNLNYFFIVCLFSLLVCCLLYKILKIFF